MSQAGHQMFSRAGVKTRLERMWCAPQLRLHRSWEEAWQWDFDSLPIDVLVTILDFADNRTIGNFRCASRSTQLFVDTTAAVWRSRDLHCPTTLQQPVPSITDLRQQSSCAILKARRRYFRHCCRMATSQGSGQAAYSLYVMAWEDLISFIRHHHFLPRSSDENWSTLEGGYGELNKLASLMPYALSSPAPMASKRKLLHLLIELLGFLYQAMALNAFQIQHLYPLFSLSTLQASLAGVHQLSRALGPDLLSFSTQEGLFQVLQLLRQPNSIAGLQSLRFRFELARSVSELKQIAASPSSRYMDGIPHNVLEDRFKAMRCIATFCPSDVVRAARFNPRYSSFSVPSAFGCPSPIVWLSVFGDVVVALSADGVGVAYDYKHHQPLCILNKSAGEVIHCIFDNKVAVEPTLIVCSSGPSPRLECRTIPISTMHHGALYMNARSSKIFLSEEIYHPGFVEFNNVNQVALTKCRANKLKVSESSQVFEGISQTVVLQVWSLKSYKPLFEVEDSNVMDVKFSQGFLLLAYDGAGSTITLKIAELVRGHVRKWVAVVGHRHHWFQPVGVKNHIFGNGAP